MKVTFDDLKSSIKLGAKEIELPRLSFKLFEVLYSNKNHLVTNEQLLSQVWPDTTVSQDTVKQRVFLLRQQIEEASIPNLEIVSIRGHGYSLKTRTNPLFVLGISVFGFILFSMIPLFLLIIYRRMKKITGLIMSSEWYLN